MTICAFKNCGSFFSDPWPVHADVTTWKGFTNFTGPFLGESSVDYPHKGPVTQSFRLLQTVKLTVSYLRRYYAHVTSYNAFGRHMSAVTWAMASDGASLIFGQPGHKWRHKGDRRQLVIAFINSALRQHPSIFLKTPTAYGAGVITFIMVLWNLRPVDHCQTFTSFKKKILIMPLIDIIIGWISQYTSVYVYLPIHIVNTLRPKQNYRHFPDDSFKWIFLNENIWISIEVSLKFVPKGPINNTPALVQIMAWRRPGDKPLSEPMMVSLLTHICVTRPQWVKLNTLRFKVISVAYKNICTHSIHLVRHYPRLVQKDMLSRDITHTPKWKIAIMNIIVFQMLMVTFHWKPSCHDANFFATGSTGGCHNDNQWRQNWHHADSVFSDQGVEVIDRMWIRHHDVERTGELILGDAISLIACDLRKACRMMKH